MNFSSSLTDHQLPMVIDTSVLINLHSCTYGRQILTTIPNKIIVPKLVAGEFERGIDDKAFLTNLVSERIAEIDDTNEDEDIIFGRLIMTLDDGESATIAIAINRGFLPIIDERKGRAQLKLMKPDLEPGWSIDLIRHPVVASQLGPTTVVEALYLALRVSHMRIPEEGAEEVIALIGEKRARECTCIPNYKKRFPRM